MGRSLHLNVNTAAAFRAMRLRPGRVVIISPHPDDETLGTGRLILAARRCGVTPAFILLTDGGASHPQSHNWPSQRLGRLRMQELRRALGRLGIADPAIRHMRWRDGQVAEDGRVQALRAMLHSLKARTVLVTSPADHHADHKAAYRLAAAAVDRQTMTLWTYAVWSRVNTSPKRTFEPVPAQQIWAMRAHRSQTGTYINDDPTGFTFTPAVLKQILRSQERYAHVNRKDQKQFRRASMSE